MAFFPLLSKRALLQGGNARAQLHVLRIAEEAAVSMVSALVFERPGLKLSWGHGVMGTSLTARKLIRPEVDSHEMIVTEDYGLFIIR